MRFVARTARQDNALYGADALSAVQVGCRSCAQSPYSASSQTMSLYRLINGLTSQTQSSAVQAWKPFAALLTSSCPCEPILLAISYPSLICKFGDSCKVCTAMHLAFASCPDLAHMHASFAQMLDVPSNHLSLQALVEALVEILRTIPIPISPAMLVGTDSMY